MNEFVVNVFAATEELNSSSTSMLAIILEWKKESDKSGNIFYTEENTRIEWRK